MPDMDIIVGMRLGDYLHERLLLVLELNDGIMFENYARQSEANKKRATDVYDAIIAAMVR